MDRPSAVLRRGRNQYYLRLNQILRTIGTLGSDMQDIAINPKISNWAGDSPSFASALVSSPALFSSILAWLTVPTILFPSICSVIVRKALP